jgi:tRNA threonylcarbamoyladenosine biosynthesis protein TsaE
MANKSANVNLPVNTLLMPADFIQLSYTLENIDQAVNQFWEFAAPYSILAFSGEMGAGKTTFIHHLCDYLNVADTVSSPTFALVNEYHFDDKAGAEHIIYHLDWYRLKSAEEAINAGMEDCILQARIVSGYCFIEWPEKAQELIRPPYLLVRIESTDMVTRKLVATVNT